MVVFSPKIIDIGFLICLLCVRATIACTNDSDCKAMYANREQMCCRGGCNFDLCQDGKLRNGCTHDDQCDLGDSCGSDGNCGSRLCAEENKWKVALIGCAVVASVLVLALVTFTVYKLIKTHSAARETNASERVLSLQEEELCTRQESVSNEFMATDNVSHDIRSVSSCAECTIDGLQEDLT